MDTSMISNNDMRHGHSGNLGPVTQYTVRATSDNDAIVVFGLAAEDYDRAVLAASERLPWHPKVLTVQPLLPPDRRTSAVSH
jgi:plasmid stabilization system protein ParE